MNSKLYTLSKRLLIAVGLGLGLTVALLWTLGAGQLPTAYAASYTVTRGDDPPPDGCNLGDCSLREAVIAANTNPGPDTITLPADTYILSIAGTGEDAAQTGDLDITESVDINGAGRDTTMIDANRIDSVFEVLTGSVTFSGVTIQRGYRTDAGDDGGGIRYDAEGGTLTIVNSKFFSNTGHSDGGGISMEENADNGSLSVRNSIFISNTADVDEGGAINIDSLTNTITIVDSDFIGNTADDEGGALHTEGNFYTISIEDSLFQNNRTMNGTGTRGGGAINLEGITVTIDIVDSRFISNTSASEGGALRTSNPNQVIRIWGSTFISNTALDAGGTFDGGGAICIEDDSTTVEIYRSRFYSNTTESFVSGGAISAVGDAANLQIHGSGFRGNTSARDGGAIEFASDGGILEISNSTLSGNEAVDYGGGIDVRANVTATVSGLGDLGVMDARPRDTVQAPESWVEDAAEPDGDDEDDAIGVDGGDVRLLDTAVLRVQLNNVTIADNIADSNAGGLGDGGGMWVHPDLLGRVNVANSIIADNQDDSPATLVPDCSAAAGGIVSFGYNLVGDSSGCNWTAATDDQVGTGGSPVDPLLDPVVDTLAVPAFAPLQAGSPAIDAGNPGPVSDVAFPACRTRDQRGVSRPKEGRCDIGAYEVGDDTYLYLPVVMRQ